MLDLWSDTPPLGARTFTCFTFELATILAQPAQPDNAEITPIRNGKPLQALRTKGLPVIPGIRVMARPMIRAVSHLSTQR